jgi:hypothetical protein
LSIYVKTVKTLSWNTTWVYREQTKSIAPLLSAASVFSATTHYWQRWISCLYFFIYFMFHTSKKNEPIYNYFFYIPTSYLSCLAIKQDKIISYTMNFLYFGKKILLSIISACKLLKKYKYGVFLFWIHEFQL